MVVTLLNNRYALSTTPKAGGMADVYRATDLMQDGHPAVAVKIFRYGGVEEEILRESFRRETTALRELIHPNIVQLVEAGTDPGTNRLYVVTEWVEQSLPEWLKARPLDDWDDYYTQIGKGLLTALHFAHSRRFTHRDVKPANVLVTDRGVPKLADFGIAKLHAFMQPGVTLSAFASQPFAPPEPDEGVNTFSRDLYGFAALSLTCFARSVVRTRDDLEKTLATANLPDDVRTLLSRCLSLDAAARPLHAGVLLSELDLLERKRTQARIPRRVLYMTVAPSKLDGLKRETGVETEAELLVRLTEELNGPCAIEPFIGRPGTQLPGERHYRLHASTLCFHAKVEDSNDHLILFRCWAVRPGDCERHRDAAWPVPYVFRFRRPTDPIEGAETIRQLELGVQSHQAELREKEAERREQHLFDTWSNLLKARLQFEAGKNPPIAFDGISEEGDCVRLSILAPVSEEVIGQAWKIPINGAPPIRGEIEAVFPDAVLFRPSATTPDGTPRRGVLKFDDWAAEQAIERQKLALEAVRLDRGVKGNLKRLLLHPAECRIPRPEPDVDFVKPDLDEAKQKAVRVALGVEDLILVEGPPGTGKTTFIAELVLQYLRRHPEQRVLLASQTHVALDNAIERLRAADQTLRLVRVAGRFTSERVSEPVRDCLLDIQLERWRREALEAGRQHMLRWGETRGIVPESLQTVELLIELRELLTVEAQLNRQREELERQLSEAPTDGAGPDDMERGEAEEDQRRLKRESEQVGRRVRDLEKRLKKVEELAAEFVKLTPEQLDHEIRSYLPTGDNGEMARTLVELHAQWSIRFGRTSDFSAALLVASQVVAGTCVGVMGVKGADTVEYDLCIVDEASKATSTELLVPLSRARRFVVVGDPRQLSPFQEPDFKSAALTGPFGLSEDDLKTTLFDHLVAEMPTECRVTLTTQHRMVKPIGDLISDCFYDSMLHSPRTPEPAAFDAAVAKRVIWFSTSRLANRNEQGKMSISNPCEVREITALLKRMAFLANRDGRSYTVAVVTGYSDQKRSLQRAIQAERAAWNDLFRIEVNTVDAFQGREADIAIYSITRSNRVGAVGFLQEHERINVALSRGKEFLFIVGDHAFCRRIRGDNALKKVLDYVETHPATCLLSEVE